MNNCFKKFIFYSLMTKLFIFSSYSLAGVISSQVLERDFFYEITSNDDQGYTHRVYWLDHAEPDITGDVGLFTQGAAVEKCKSKQSLLKGSPINLHLPSQKEFEALKNFFTEKNVFQLDVLQAIFPEMSLPLFWSSTPQQEYPEAIAYLFYSYDGSMHPTDNTLLGAAYCVYSEF